MPLIPPLSKVPPLPAVPVGPRVVSLQRLAAGGRWRVEAMRSYSHPCLLWFSKGQGRITLQGQTRGYTANNVLFIPAGVMHGFEVGANTFGSCLFIGSEHLMGWPDAPLHLRLRESQPQHEIAAFFEVLQREISSDLVAADRACLHHMGLLSVWLERQALRQSAEAKETAKGPNATLRLVQRFTALLEETYRNGDTIAQMAQKLGVTPTHLSRCCRASSGRPASELLQDRRLFEARKLLLETKLPIQQIASDLGFASAAYFTRAFQHTTGQAPSAFRRLA